MHPPIEDMLPLPEEAYSWPSQTPEKEPFAK